MIEIELGAYIALLKENGDIEESKKALVNIMDGMYYQEAIFHHIEFSKPIPEEGVLINSISFLLGKTLMKYAKKAMIDVLIGFQNINPDNIKLNRGSFRSFVNPEFNTLKDATFTVSSLDVFYQYISRFKFYFQNEGKVLEQMGVAHAKKSDNEFLVVGLVFDFEDGSKLQVEGKEFLDILEEVDDESFGTDDRQGMEESLDKIIQQEINKAKYLRKYYKIITSKDFINYMREEGNVDFDEKQAKLFFLDAIQTNTKKQLQEKFSI